MTKKQHCFGCGKVSTFQVYKGYTYRFCSKCYRKSNHESRRSNEYSTLFDIVKDVLT